jgi:3-oxoacyl-(acyl-carrier-protein) synthase
MSLHIAGMGWVTPLGRGIQPVWERLLAGEEAGVHEISGHFGGREYPFFPVPGSALKDLPSHPRLRRASAISRFAIAAGLDALDEVKSLRAIEARATGPPRDTDSTNWERLAVIFAISNGGVVYTKRFYHDVVLSGAQSASPLLFPETVFNAPASHLAALLGITGVTYTLVGDGTVGLLAIQMADDLMTNRAFDFCLVVAAEEADWLLCDAYRRWRLLKAEPPIEPFRRPPGGMILSEGAGAILFARRGSVTIDKIDPGTNFSQRNEASQSIRRIISDLADTVAEVLVTSANGTFVDLAEEMAIVRQAPDAIVYSLKPALGESVGASAIWQVIAAAQSLRTKRLPPLLHARTDRGRALSFSSGTEISARTAVVVSCGLNQQVAGLRLSI